MCRIDGTIDPKALRALERQVDERIFGRRATRATPRYARNVDAANRLAQRLASLGLLINATAHGLEIEDLCLGTTYFYGTTLSGATDRAPCALLVRGALFVSGMRHSLRLPRKAPMPRHSRSSQPFRRVA